MQATMFLNQSRMPLMTHFTDVTINIMMEGSDHPGSLAYRIAGTTVGPLLSTTGFANNDDLWLEMAHQRVIQAPIANLSICPK